MAKQTKHERLRSEAEKAIDALNNDTSVDLMTTRDSLGELRDHIKMLMDAIRATAEE